MVHVPPELVELIVYHAWGCLSTSSHRHAHSMANWMLVSRDWLKIVLSVVFRDLWITSYAHIKYIVRMSRPSNTSFICELAGIANMRRHLIQTCRSLTISVYHSYEGEYAAQCTDLLEYATTDSLRNRLLPGVFRYENPVYAIPCDGIATFIGDFTPSITVLHFVLIDCVATYRNWNTSPGLGRFMRTMHFPLPLIELHVTFAYTSPPPTLLLDARRGTFYPPPWPCEEMPEHCRFGWVRRLVVRDANADFVAFLTTTCPRLERVESTAEFSVRDVPQDVSEDVKAKLVFVRLPRTATWPGLTGSDTGQIPKHLPRTPSDWYDTGLTMSAIRPDPPSTKPSIPARNKKHSIWRLVKRIFRERK
ncbi:hypothetical protein B0H13DRAFT_2328210 [Mycena leptocephala]|nr:hypothetical protein B0H13DRAFT_2328210 [Mycena leptocephala]